MKGESGFRMPFIWERRVGRSLTQWREREERTALKDWGSNGRGWSTGGRTVRVWEGRRLLKGSEASRWRRVGEVSTEVMWERRVDRVGESGVGTVRARAMLQAFAPKSRTLGKCRLISCAKCSARLHGSVYWAYLPGDAHTICWLLHLEDSQLFYSPLHLSLHARVVAVWYCR